MLFCGLIYSTLSNGHKCIDYIIFIKFKEHMIFFKAKEYLNLTLTIVITNSTRCRLPVHSKDWNATGMAGQGRLVIW
jgi:hypothetical protein